MCNTYVWRKQNKLSYSHQDLSCLAVTNTFVPSHFQFKPSIKSFTRRTTWIIFIIKCNRILSVSVNTLYSYTCMQKYNSPTTHWIPYLLGTWWMHRKTMEQKSSDVIKTWQVELLLSNPTFKSTPNFHFSSSVVSSS